MVFDLGLLAAAVRGIHQDDVKLIVHCVVQHVPKQAVVVEYLRHVQIVLQHVGDAEHVRELLLLNAVDGLTEGRPILSGLDFLFQFFQPGSEKAAGAASEVYLTTVFDTKPIM